jgi:hypothetical protein
MHIERALTPFDLRNRAIGRLRRLADLLWPEYAARVEPAGPIVDQPPLDKPPLDKPTPPPAALVVPMAVEDIGATAGWRGHGDAFSMWVDGKHVANASCKAGGEGHVWTHNDWGYKRHVGGGLREAIEVVAHRAARVGIAVPWPAGMEVDDDEALEGWDGHEGHAKGDLFVYMVGGAKPYAATNRHNPAWRSMPPVYGRHSSKEDAMREAWGQWTQTIETEVKTAAEVRWVRVPGQAQLWVGDLILAFVRPMPQGWQAKGRNGWQAHGSGTLGSEQECVEYVKLWGARRDVVVPALEPEESDDEPPDEGAPLPAGLRFLRAGNGDVLEFEVLPSTGALRLFKVRKPGQAWARPSTAAPGELRAWYEGREPDSDALVGWEPDGDGFKRGDLVVYPTPHHGRTEDGKWPWWADTADGCWQYGLHATPDDAKRAAHGRVTDSDPHWTQTVGSSR